MNTPIMAKATAVWLIDNSTLSFQQIAAFCGLHELEVRGIADGDVAVGIKGCDPISSDQLDASEIARGEADPNHRLRLKKTNHNTLANRPRERRYTPMSKRQERPAAILWLVRNHPAMNDGHIAKLVGTTKTTIQSIRERTHWNISQIEPVDPVALGFCKQSELDEAVKTTPQEKSKTEKNNTGKKNDHSLQGTEKMRS